MMIKMKIMIMMIMTIKMLYNIMMIHLNFVYGTVGEVSEEGPSDLGVDEAVSHYEDVEQTLPQASAVLNNNK